MNIQGKIVQVLPMQSGEGKKGQWKRQQIIVEILGPYPKTICVSIWGALINESILIPGNNMDISIDIESKEFNGKWYTDIKAWKIELVKENIAPTPVNIASLKRK
ncbi:MAG: DUF3127 domain-containing protein [Bacteroidetes bacterium]|nr:DUF3127 domain-containing protein [Bacteroidota bacterium]